MKQKPTRIYAVSGPESRAVYVSTHQGEKEKFFHIEVYRRKADGKLIEYQSLLSETTLFMLMLALSGAARDNDIMQKRDDIGYTAFTYEEAVAAGLFGPDHEPEPEART